jgi:exodeoxyribonuclease VII small subunit
MAITNKITTNKMTTKKKTDSGNLNFEASIGELEQIVAALETQLPLEQALEKFEQGIKLSNDCQRKLQAAEQKVKILLTEQGGEVLKDFQEEV